MSLLGLTSLLGLMSLPPFLARLRLGLRFRLAHGRGVGWL
jgi:hypothetical protein